MFKILKLTDNTEARPATSMFKNKSPYSHHQPQPQSYLPKSPINSALEPTTYMFSQTLAAHKNKNIPPHISPTNINANNIGGFGALFKKNSQNNNNNNSSNSNEVEDLDLGCDQVLVQNNKVDIDFTCNQSLIPISKYPTNNAPTSIPSRRLQQRHHSNLTPPVLLDLKCNEQLHQKQPRQSSMLEQVYRRVYSMLEGYQRTVMQQQKKINQLQAQRQTLIRINMGK